jgi:hypothetical protein
LPSVDGTRELLFSECNGPDAAGSGGGFNGLRLSAALKDVDLKDISIEFAYEPYASFSGPFLSLEQLLGGDKGFSTACEIYSAIPQNLPSPFIPTFWQGRQLFRLSAHNPSGAAHSALMAPFSVLKVVSTDPASGKLFEVVEEWMAPCLALDANGNCAPSPPLATCNDLTGIRGVSIRLDRDGRPRKPEELRL